MSRRLQTEVRQFQSTPVSWCSINLRNDNMFHIIATITGPENSPYEGGRFDIELEIPTEYPFKPPKIKFLTKTYHPNIILKDGTVCTREITDNWSPQMKIQDVLMVLRQLLNEPHIDHPLDPEICELYKNNRAEFNRKAREWANKHESI
eukprot:TRINITY_DN361_c0_g3_i1.p1 TRINITY_DN361_c0_g3~~TRINITY_DN361_c0_g3_i1.p1  ORF type:complete len:149 (-),score=62.10 TRINITY_DN361_c0_g3_i1:233-679(-)